VTAGCAPFTLMCEQHIHHDHRVLLFQAFQGFTPLFIQGFDALRPVALIEYHVDTDGPDTPWLQHTYKQFLNG
jgi:hypothetical protein